MKMKRSHIVFHRTKNSNFSICNQRITIEKKTHANKSSTMTSYMKILALMMVIMIILIDQIIIVVGDDKQSKNFNRNNDKNNGQMTRMQGASSIYGRDLENFDISKYSSWDGEDTISENDIDSTSRAPEPFKSQHSYSCGRAIVHGQYKDFFPKDQNYHVSRSKYRPTEIRMPRIIGGDETAPGEFPWTVSVKLNGQPICGGSLIDKSWILTAAHCVVGYNPKNLTVRLGAYRIKDTSETQTLDVPVSMFIVHKEYSMPRPFSNDIALLKLNEQIEFTDFIIPICLPTEDQASTSSSSISGINDDYTSKFETGKESEDSGGIVVSTKMSDTDIADCFNKLEQNYLISIGLGPISESTSPEPQSVGPQQQSALQAPLKAVLSKPRPSLPILPPPHQSGQLFSYGNLFGPSYSANNIAHSDKPDEDNRITFSTIISQTKPTVQHFDGIPHFKLPSADAIGGSFNGQQDNYIYYGIPWKGGDNYGYDDNHISNYDKVARKDAIRLSRLPISKELLKEIQSVGSGPMPSLNLGLQKGDLVAMASDLTTTPASNNPQVNTDRGRPNKLTNTHLLRTNNVLEDEAQGQQVHTEYSGLNGIVVGWGWVRELDSDDQVNNKGYPSVTLQKVRLPILRNNVCEAWFQSQSKKITLLPSQFCAGFNSGGKDACRVGRLFELSTSTHL